MSISLPFNIHSPFHPGGFLQFFGADLGVSATLGSGGSDPWQQVRLALSPSIQQRFTNNLRSVVVPPTN